jgi:hypothetical protein
LQIGINYRVASNRDALEEHATESLSAKWEEQDELDRQMPSRRTFPFRHAKNTRPNQA